MYSPPIHPGLNYTHGMFFYDDVETPFPTLAATNSSLSHIIGI